MTPEVMCIVAGPRVAERGIKPHSGGIQQMEMTEVHVAVKVVGQEM